MKKWLSILLVAVMALAALAGCAQQPAAQSEAPAQEAAQPAPEAPAEAPEAEPEQAPATDAKLAVVTGTGGLGDKNLNDFAYAGVSANEADGVKVDVVQPGEISDAENLQRLYAESGEYAAIVCIAFDNAEALKTVAPEFPEQRFVICDTTVDAPNVTSVVFRAEETGFQLGVLAGLLAKESALPNAQNKNTIGFVGGKDITSINTFAAGYEAGAKLVDPDVTILRAYVGSFADPSTAAELATGLYDQGADIVFACAGGSGLGVITAAENKNLYALGIETNQNTVSPEHVIASGTRDWVSAVYDVTSKAVAGTLEAGVASYGIVDGGIVAERSGSNVVVSDAITATVDNLSAMVADGTLKLPTTLDAVDAFVQGNAALIAE